MINEDKTQELRDFLIGSSNTQDRAAIILNIDENEMDDYIEAANIECCASCGWWWGRDDVTESMSELICPDCIDG